MTPSDAAERWLQQFHPASGSAVRLVCFPHAGGAASYFFPWSQALTPQVEVIAVQYPGRQDRRLEKTVDTITALAGHIAAAVPSRIEGPYAFFGHSMGAILAYEVARLLEPAGTGPVRLVASGRRAPSRRPDGPADTIHLRDDAGLVAELRSSGATDPRVLDDEELLALILPSVRADYRAIETYTHVPGPPLTCPITAIVGDHDPKATIDEASAWAGHTTGGFDLRVFPGGHFYLDDHAAAVIETVRGAISPLPA